jgi:hypothetical protein
VRDYRTHEERRIAERFPGDVAGHQVTVLHDAGLYRHLRCVPPDHSTWWFEIVTWPGSLAVRGDMGGGWIFSRVEDMFTFFRGKGHGTINPGYWAEKLPDCGRSVRVYSEGVFRARLDEALTDYDQAYPDLAAEHRRAKAAYATAPERERYPWKVHGPKEPAELKTLAEVRELVADHDTYGQLASQNGAYELLRELEQADVVSDSYGWSMSDWDWPFLWACHAIVWAIREYDRQRAGGGDRG